MVMDSDSRTLKSGLGIELGKIEQHTTPATITNVLRAAILDGSLAPGSQLREAHIAADMGVSRASLREALGNLADQGLVVKVAYRGAFVTEISAADIAEIATLRVRLEPYAIELALPHLKAGGRSVLVDSLHDMIKGADDADFTRVIDAHMAFHRSFYEFSGHRRLLNEWQSWEAQLQLFFSADHRSFADQHDVVSDHERLLSVIDTGDLTAISKEIADHIHVPDTEGRVSTSPG